MDLRSFNDFCATLSTESHELFLNSQVPTLSTPPSALEFLRDWVNPNRPVLIQGVSHQWPATKKWETSYLRSTLKDTRVTVAITPNGYADAVTDGKFILPEERSMPFSDFLDVIEGTVTKDGVYYVQKQNSNFTDEFEILMTDAEGHIPWASEALGKRPDAVNFWMGEGHAVTSMHKDHYENLYTVIRGSKTFTLIPPTDQPFVPYEEYPVAQFHESSPGVWEVVPDKDGSKVPWIAIDPLKPDLEKYPSYQNARPITVTVHEGETLYLPSLWFHHVQQSHGCIAVNFWYDMEYDIKYTYFKFVEELVKKVKS